MKKSITNKCNEILYFDFSIAEHGPEAEPALVLQDLYQPHFILQTLPLLGETLHILIVLAVIRGLDARVDVHRRWRRYEHYNKRPGRPGYRSIFVTTQSRANISHS